jgi:MFS family permease
MNSIKKIAHGKLFMFALPLLFFMRDQCWDIKLLSFEIAARINPYEEIVAGACLLLWGASLFNMRKADCRQRQYRYIVIGIFLVVLISYLFGSVLVYHQDLRRIWRVMFWFSGILTYFFLMRTNGYAQNALGIYRLLVIYGLVATGFSLLVAFAPTVSHVIRESALLQRFGMIRYNTLQDVTCIALFYFLSLFLVATQRQGPRGRLSSLIGIAITLFCLFFVGLSRQRIFSITAVILVVSTLSLFLSGFNRQAGFFTLITMMIMVIVALVTPDSFMGLWLRQYMAPEVRRTDLFTCDWRP